MSLDKSLHLSLPQLLHSKNETDRTPFTACCGVAFISTGQMRSTVREPCFPLGTVELASLLNLQFLESQCTEPSVTSHCLSDLADFTSHSQIISVDYSYSHVSFSFIAYHQLSSFFLLISMIF